MADRRSGTRLRVTAQLITAADGSHLWSRRFDRELADIFDMQDDITNAITAALRVRLSGAIASQRRAAGTPAYDAFLRAKDFLAKESPDAFEASRRHMEEAIALEPGFALAHGWLSALHVYFAGFMLHPAREAMPLARIPAQRAVELDPSLSEAHSLLGVVAAAFDYDWAEAARCFRLAMARDPVSPNLFLQDIDQAAHWARKSIEQRDLVIPFLLRHPIADPLRASRHWPSLAAMMNLPAMQS